MFKLLTRDEFREGVFARDGHKCVVCGAPAVDAHHIIERRLFQETHEQGGYFLENGASVCEEHHLACEMTTISTDEIREYAGIMKKVIPSHLYGDQPYDKWGNPILPNGQRIKGELFFDASVQKILGEGGVLGDFTQYVKYPRTFHLPWSPGIHDDDRMHSTTDQWKDKDVIVGIKMDGENTSVYNNYVHARSVDSPNHASRNWVKNFASTFQFDIPEGWRVCGENMFATHSIHYDDLTSYFIGFGVWNDRNECLGWDETLEWFDLLGIEPNRVIYEGPYDEDLIRGIHNQLDFEKDEGYVMRTRDGFSYGDYRKYVGKYVRQGHVQTVKHWMHGQPIIPNKLVKGS